MWPGIMSSQGRSAPTPPAPSGLIISFGAGTSENHTFQNGWRFTVGGSALTAVGLRVYLPSPIPAGTPTETLRLWRHSDTALLDSVVVPDNAVDTWIEGMFASPITLAAGASYTVSRRSTNSGTRFNYSRPASGTAFDPRVTFVEGVFGLDNNYPAAVTSAVNLFGIVDVLVNP